MMNIICAFNVNLDAVHSINEIELAELISRLEIMPKLERPETISSVDDFFSGLLYCMSSGSGNEFIIDNPQVANIINSLFSWEDRLGGNAGIMANAIAAQGAEPILNVPALTKKTVNLLNPIVKIPKKSKLVSPAEAIRNEHEPVHFVIQFQQGLNASISSGKICSSRENRLIATYDELNGRIYSDPDFDAFCEDNLDKVDGALVSGFHLVPLSDYRNLLDKKINQISRWKRIKAELFIHAEMANFQRAEVMTYLLERLVADSVGMNEDELGTLYDFKPNWKGVLGAAQDLRSRFRFERVCIHTRDYILSIVNDIINPNEEIEALAYGADLAATFAATGKIMKPLSTNINPIGASIVKEFCRSGAKPSGRGSCLRTSDEYICIIPAQFVERPRITVGLGDIMTASAFYREALSWKKWKIASYASK
jgi:ADP-dependent phosphofructokinase/glucokinase